MRTRRFVDFWKMLSILLKIMYLTSLVFKFMWVQPHCWRPWAGTVVVTLTFYVPVHDAIICHAVSDIKFGWYDESVHFSGHFLQLLYWTISCYTLRTLLALIKNTTFVLHDCMYAVCMLHVCKKLAKLRAPVILVQIKWCPIKTIQLNVWARWLWLQT